MGCNARPRPCCSGAPMSRRLLALLLVPALVGTALGVGLAADRVGLSSGPGAERRADEGGDEQESQEAAGHRCSGAAGTGSGVAPHPTRRTAAGLRSVSIDSASDRIS